MTMPRLLVTDVDRTILTHDHALPSRVKEQFARAKEAGVLLVLATARSPTGVRPYAEQLKPDWTICFNGGWTGDPMSSAALRRSSINRDLALNVMAAALAEGLRALWFSEQGIHVLEDDDVIQREAAITKEPLHVARSLDDLPGAPGKIMCVALEAEGQQRFELIRAKFRDVLSLSRSHARLLEIGAHGVSKRAAIQSLAADLKISPQDCAAAGDAENDLGMLAWAGTALTVENATPEAKQLAHYVGPSCDVGGMADAVAWLLRGKMAAEAV
jgi:Cof subfamily protein (haloacid dehalogenase superfamily)